MGNSVIYRPAYDAEVEYLESTGTQWIDTGIIPNQDYAFEVCAKVRTNDIHVIFGTRNGWPSALFGHELKYSSFEGIYLFWGNHSSYSGEKITNEWLVLYGKQGSQKVTYQSDGSVICSDSYVSNFQCNDSALIFATHYISNINKDSCLISYVKIWNQDTLIRDFIPVRIGQVGYMYDKVTKQLFANKGTGNFILGNDVSNAVIPQQRCVLYFGNQRSVGFERIYEEYEWLKAEIPIGVAMMSLPINSSTFNCTIEHTGARANLPHLYSDGYIYFTNSSNMDMIAVWNVSEANIPFSASVGSLMIIESNEEYFKVNNISIIKYGFPITRMVIQSSYNSNNATTTKTSKITIDGSVRYAPCKLTHGIPASMDANGIARPAGTCGMWDKVNDKFYGNVANSGTFTVSND